jgi:hypothetical protein
MTGIVALLDSLRVTFHGNIGAVITKKERSDQNGNH